MSSASSTKKAGGPLDVFVVDGQVRKEMDRFCDWLNKTEGRDKFGKIFQFGCRGIAGLLADMGYTDLAKLFELFWRNMLDARRMQWFGKSMIEYRTMVQTYENAMLPPDVKYLHTAARGAFALRWGIENVMILCKHKIILSGTKWQDLNVPAKKAWSLAILLGLATEFAKLKHIMSSQDYASGEEGDKKREADKKKSYTMMVQHLCDVPVTLVIGYEKKVSDKWVGLFHMCAALLQSRGLYPAAK